MEDLTREEAYRLLRDERVAHVGVISHGEPYVSPVSYVVDGQNLYFRTGHGRRVDAIREVPRVCVETYRVHDDTGDWESAIAWGDAEILEDGPEAQRVIELLLEKYHDDIGSAFTFSWAPPLGDRALIVKVPLDDLSGRCSGRGFSPRTRPGRL